MFKLQLRPIYVILNHLEIRKNHCHSGHESNTFLVIVYHDLYRLSDLAHIMILSIPGSKGVFERVVLVSLS